MKSAELEALWREAQRRGLLPAQAPCPEVDDSRPWPVVLLTALGAWLAAVPLLVVVGLLFGPLLMQGGAYVAGIALLAAAGVMLRSPGLPLFVEQLAVPLLLTGGVSLGFASFHDLPGAVAALLMAGLALGMGTLARPPGLKACLGGAAAGLVAFSFRAELGDAGAGRLWLGWHAVAMVWLAGAAWERRRGLSAGLRALAAGWGAAVLFGLALGSGMAMMASGVLGGGMLASGLAAPPWARGVSVLLALLAAAVLGRAWASLRRPGLAGVALVLAGLAAFMPALGAVLLIGAASLVQARWRLAVAAGVAAAWVVGAFYYSLAWPLATKAEVLAAAGVLLAVLTAPRGWRGAGAAPVPAAGRRGMRVAAAVFLVAVLAVVQLGIAQKEALIAQGQPVYVPLAPADPRSLMQGDYMRLAFAIPADVPEPAGGLFGSGRPRVVMQLDERRIARALRLHAGEPLAAGELLIELTPARGRWTLVTDAWFFREGQAQRWAPARFGEFRVLPDGQALLVGLRGEGLAAL